MKSGNRIRTIASAFLFAVLFSGVSARLQAADTKAASLALRNGVRAELKITKDKLAGISMNGKWFAPNDKGKVICSVKIDIRNEGDTEYKLKELQSIEMVLVNKAGEVEFASWTRPLDFTEAPSPKNQQAPILPGQAGSDSLYFIHSKGFVPAAFVSDRVEKAILLKSDDPRNERLNIALDKASAMQSALQMASVLQFEEVSDFMSANGLDINAVNRNGVSLLYAGILSKNDSVVEGTIKRGADIHSIVMMSIHPIEPIHAAVLANNKFAIQALLAAGASLTAKPKEGDEPAVLAARENNVEALKTLVEFGLDIKGVMIPMNWSPAIPISKFAQRPGYEAMLEYLNSL